MTTVAATPEMQFCFDNRAPQTIERLLAACGFKKFIGDQNTWHMFVRAWKTTGRPRRDWGSGSGLGCADAQA